MKAVAHWFVAGIVLSVSSTAFAQPDYYFADEWDGFSNPADVAVDSSDNVYVVEQGGNRVRKLTSTGGSIATWGTAGSGNGQFNLPRAIVLDGSGNVYVADTLNHRIQKFDSSGNYILQWGTQGSGNGQFESPSGLAWDGTSIYVADTSNHRVQKFDLLGNYILQWGSFGAGNGQFNVAGDVAAVPGIVYVSDNARTQKFDSTGNYISEWPAIGQLSIDSVGNVYSSGGMFGYIYKQDADGNLITSIGANQINEANFFIVRGIGFGSDGEMYVADAFDSIQKFFEAESLPVGTGEVLALTAIGLMLCAGMVVRRMRRA